MLTISETCYYYGRINAMDKIQIKDNIEFLINLLDLQSKKNQCIKNMSGGQKRRVSLTIALLHSPDLLILDEPTVGVDPLLRQKEFFVNLSHIAFLHSSLKISSVY